MSYTKKIFSTGAVRKTPKRIINRIVGEVDTTRNINVIEIGAGKGEITIPLKEKLETAQRNPGSVYAFEIDEIFSKELAENVNPVKVITASAFDLAKHLPEGFLANYIISSMPLSFYDRKAIKELLSGLDQLTNPGGKIIILFHAFWLIPFLKKTLPGSRVVSYATIPPYFLLIYEKKGQ